MTAGVDHDGRRWVTEVLRFWFEETPSQLWFQADPGLDARIRKQFAALHARLSAEPPLDDPVTANGSLAAIVVFDQFSRNMFRGTRAAFASDQLGLSQARRAVAAGVDRSLDSDGRLFLYLPFEHSEDLADQELSVTLIGTLGDPEKTRYAIAHRDIIKRFGRFPHRNGALGRLSTAEEQAFLLERGSSF